MPSRDLSERGLKLSIWLPVWTQSAFARNRVSEPGTLVKVGLAPGSPSVK